MTPEHTPLTAPPPHALADWLRARPRGATGWIDLQQVAAMIEQYDECVQLLRRAVAERDRWIAQQPPEPPTPELDQLPSLRAALRHCAAALHAIRDAELQPEALRDPARIAHRAALAEQIARDALAAIEHEKEPA